VPLDGAVDHGRGSMVHGANQGYSNILGADAWATTDINRSIMITDI